MINGNTFYFDFEVTLMEFLQRLLGGAGVSIVSFFSAFGEEMIMILILGFLFWCYDKKFGIYVGINVMIGIVINPLIKNIFWRRRPYFDNEGIKCLRPVEKSADIYDISAQGFSFPSGHSTNAVTAYGSIAGYKRKPIFTVLAIVLPLVVGFSRVVVGVHYPTDVLCGWLLGLIVIFAVPAILEKAGSEKRWLVFLIIFIISCVGLLYCKTTDYFTGLGLMGGFFLAVEFEDRYVKFENTKKPLLCVTRILGGLIIYFAVNTILKLPFSKEFLGSGLFLAGVVRSIRYLIVSFAAIGLYPMLFKYEKKFFKA